MGKRIGTALCIVGMLMLVLSGCASGIPLTTIDGASYEVLSCVVSHEYASRVPSEGTEFLLVTIQGTEDDLNDMQTVFFGADTKAMVTDGATTAECSMIVYAPRGGNVLDVVLMFQVPTSFADSFSMYGDGFESVSLTVDKK